MRGGQLPQQQYGVYAPVPSSRAAAQERMDPRATSPIESPRRSTQKQDCYIQESPPSHARAQNDREACLPSSNGSSFRSKANATQQLASPDQSQPYVRNAAQAALTYTSSPQRAPTPPSLSQPQVSPLPAAQPAGWDSPLQSSAVARKPVARSQSQHFIKLYDDDAPPPADVASPPTPSRTYSGKRQIGGANSASAAVLHRRASGPAGRERPEAEQLLRGACHNVVFVGNPGAGKSTLLNALLGEAGFRSGVSLGAGLTKFHSSRVVSSSVAGGAPMLLLDTPGLDDARIREQAGGEIATALSTRALSLRVVVVATLEAGRVRPADVATARLVGNALKKGGVRCIDSAGGSGGVGVDALPAVGLLLNKVERKVAEQLSNDSRALEKVIAPFRKAAAVASCDLVELDMRALGASNAALGGAQARRVQEFVDAMPRLAPPSGPVVVEWRRFEQLERALEDERARLLEQMRAAGGAGEARNRHPHLQQGPHHSQAPLGFHWTMGEVGHQAKKLLKLRRR